MQKSSPNGLAVQKIDESTKNNLREIAHRYDCYSEFLKAITRPDDLYLRRFINKVKTKISIDARVAARQAKVRRQHGNR